MSKIEPTWQQRLAVINACTKARDWCADYPATREGFALAWEQCPDSVWMLWLATRVLPRLRAIGALQMVQGDGEFDLLHEVTQKFVVDVLALLGDEKGGG